MSFCLCIALGVGGWGEVGDSCLSGELGFLFLKWDLGVCVGVLVLGRFGDCLCCCVGFWSDVFLWDVFVFIF